MRVRADPAALNRDITVPRPVSRQKSYRGLSSQASTSSGSSCASLTCLEDRIEEESEENEMVLGGPSDRREAQAETSHGRSNGNNWFPERDEYDSDKEDDDDLPEEPVVREIGPQLPGVFDDGYPHDSTMPNSGIIVTVSSEDDLPSSSTAGNTSTNSDNQLLIQLRVREYQGNFDGFAEINRFETIEEMHEFIVNNSEPMANNEASAKQNLYLDILLKERPQDRFRRLVETSKGTVRRVLARNEHILLNLFASASLENFPSPLVPKDGEDDAEEEEEEEEDVDTNENIAEVEENMKRWYMIEVIGIWLKLVTDVKGYREAIKKSVLKTRCGIENDRYEGIAVPLKYK